MNKKKIDHQNFKKFTFTNSKIEEKIGWFIKLKEMWKARCVTQLDFAKAVDKTIQIVAR